MIYGDTNYQDLIDASPATGALPRQTTYGSTEALNYGLVPLEAYPDLLVDPSDYKEVIEYCHEKQMFPIYHQYNTWCPKGTRWNQNGLPYCWAWGVTASLMDIRAKEGKPTKLLSPVSLGWTVNWASRGNYLESAIRGARERGVCEQSFTPNLHSRSYRNYESGWEENALLYRLAEVWDCDNRSDTKMVQHAITILSTGTPLYIAYNWWGHALQVCGIRWDESQKYNVVWQIRNSHNEADVIELTGSRGVPDEAYGVRASLFTGA